MGIQGVVFDVDGTLVDSNYLHVVAWARAFTAAGHQVPMAVVHRRVGRGADDLVREVLPELDDDAVDALVEAHGEHYAELRGDLQAFPRAGDLLRATAERGLRVVLASSADPDDHQANLDALGAEDAVDAATAAEDVDAAKPDPELFLRALEIGGLDADSALAVGDTVWDVESAARAGYPCVALTCGGIGEAELAGAGALVVLADPAALLDRLDEVLALAAARA